MFFFLLNVFSSLKYWLDAQLKGEKDDDVWFDVDVKNMARHYILLAIYQATANNSNAEKQLMGDKRCLIVSEVRDAYIVNVTRDTGDYPDNDFEQLAKNPICEKLYGKFEW